FTRACTMNAIYFWPVPVAALRELRRVLAVDGLLVLGFRLGKSLGRHSFAQYQNHYEIEDVRRMMEDAGFRDLRFVPARDRLGPFATAGRRQPRPRPRPPPAARQDEAPNGVAPPDRPAG